MQWEPTKDFGPEEAKRHIDIYRAELQAMAEAAMPWDESLCPPGAVVCEKDTKEGVSLLARRRPGLPIREVEGGICLAILPREELREMAVAMNKGIERFFADERLCGSGKMPILAVCRRGSIMGVAELPD